jgi:hypothetical protein
MSLVSDFVKSMAAQAMPMIGRELVQIGSLALQCVLSETQNESDFSSGGFELIHKLSAVCLSEDLPAASILKKTATTRGETFRVASISRGGTFSTITLEQVTKA